MSMDPLQRRISRITGQLRGIQQMIEEGRDGIEIMQQIAAVKKAINGVTKEVVVRDLSDDLPPERQQKLAQMFERAIQL